MSFRTWHSLPFRFKGVSVQSSKMLQFRSTASELTFVRQCSYCLLCVVSGDLEKPFTDVVVASWVSIVLLRLGG